MANLTEVSSWDAGVYQFAITDPVQGGPGGIDNSPHQALADRSLWLRNRIAAAIIQSGQTDGTTDNQQLVEAVVLHVAAVPALRLVPIPLVPTSKTVLVLTRGQATEVDGFGATYKWSSTSTAVDNGSSVVTPSSAPSTGRWLVCGLNAAALGGQAASYYATTAAVAAAVAPLAPLASPALTGTPTVPTPAATNSSTAAANTQWVGNNYVAHSGIALVWNGTAGTYYKLATLPTSGSGTYDSIHVKATLNSGYTAANDTMLDGIFGNRNGFTYVYNLFGPNNAATAIRCYAETDGSTSVYALCTSSTGFATVTILNSGTGQATLYPSPASTTTPTGTLIFNSAAPITYPPFLNVSSPLSYLTPAVAALTYLPVAGGTLTGPLTIAGADLKLYRTGGATGAIYFNSAGSASVLFDGTNFNWTASGSPVLNVNGAPIATVTQVTAAQAAAIASSNATTTAALTNYVAKAGGTMTGPLIVGANATVAGGDLTVYRAGGASGVVYLNSAQTAYVYWNGTAYNLPGGEVIANGFQLARLASPAFTGTPLAPTAATGTQTTQIATTAFAAGTFSLNANGFAKLPSGLMIAWGSVNVAAGGGSTVVFATACGAAFPNACFNVQLTVAQNVNVGIPFAYNVSATQFSTDNTNGNVITTYWLAIGR